MKLKRWILAVLLPVLFLAGSGILTSAAKADVLTNAIAGIKLWDGSNGREILKDTSGNYQMIQGGTYQYAIDFDLSAYGNNLKDGDSFSLTVPEGMTLKAGTSFPLIDVDTGIQLAVLNMSSNGTGKGGKVTITLQNLTEYYAKTVASGVKGTFFFDFTADELADKKQVSYDTSETQGNITHGITVKVRPAQTQITTAGENYAKFGGIVSPRPYDSAAIDKKGDYSHPWSLRFNTQQITYANPIVIKDEISENGAPMQFIPETFVLRAGSFVTSLSSLTNPTILVKDVDYSVEFNDTYTAFTVTVFNPGDKAFLLTYSTTSPVDGSMVGNTASMEVDGISLPQSDRRPNMKAMHVERSSRITSGGVITADISRSLVLYKVDSITKKPLAGAVFKVTAPNGEELTLPPTDANGRTSTRTFTAEEIKGQFSVTEVAAPLGYTLDPTPFNLTIDADGTVKTVGNARDLKAKTSLTVTKKWEDANNQDGKRPASVAVDILANGNKVKEVTLTGGAEEDQWTGQAEELPIFDDKGNFITYTIAETQVAGYHTPVINQADYSVTNTRVPETLDFNVTKKWNDGENQDGKRPTAVSFTLYKTVKGQKTEVDSRSLTQADNWTSQFTNLPKYEAGQEIAYSVEEADVPDYTAEITGDSANGFIITNNYTPKTVDYEVTKVWDDADNQDGKRPDSIEVQLYKSIDGGTAVEVAGKILEMSKADSSDANTWVKSFTDLPQYEGAKEITYSVREVRSPAGYRSEVSGQTITNSYTPEVTEVTGTKTWDDTDNQDGKRPDTITVKLLANGKETDSQTVSAATGWTYSFTDLPTYKDGKIITYTIAEEPVAGYSTKQDGYNLTNSYTPEKTDITATKIWNDGGNQDGKRPETITVYLVKTVGGVKTTVASKQITAADNWAASFTALPVYESGQKIAYAVEEEAVADYQTEIRDFTITNSYTPKAVDYKVTKVWDDAGNQDGKRPSAVTVQLYKSVAGSAATAVAGKTLTLTDGDKLDANTWTASFTGLPQYEAGQEITYSVKENDSTLASLAAAGYQANVNGQTITNSRKPEMVKISGRKVWEDDNNRDSKRPDSIMVKIMNGTAVVEEIQVTAANGWTFESKDLPKYANGQEIAYTVTEEGAADYTASQNRGDDGKYTLTNRYEPSKTTVSGSMIWSDADNKDGIRPDNTRLRLMADGTEVASVIVSSATGWNYNFENLPKYKDGNEIAYSIAVDPIQGYDVRIDGTQVTSTHVPVVNIGGSGSGTVSGQTDSSVSGHSASNDPSTNSALGARVSDPAASVKVKSERESAGQNRVLPKTGDEGSFLVLITGVIVSLLGGGLLLARRRAD